MPISDRRCGQPTRDGSPCRLYAIKGALVCQIHGGQLPGVKKAAAKKLAEDQVKRKIATMRDVPGMSSVRDVYTDLIDVAATNRQWRLLLQDRVSYLARFDSHSDVAGEQVRADVLLFERALERSAKVGEMLARLNLDERKAALDERVAAQLGLVIQAILGDLDLTEEQQVVAARVAPQRIRELTG